jgi:hypothetical protein
MPVGSVVGAGATVGSVVDAGATVGSVVDPGATVGSVVEGVGASGERLRYSRNSTQPSVELSSLRESLQAKSKGVSQAFKHERILLPFLTRALSYQHFLLTIQY